jgi:SAM-dependent methyltransferase
VTSLPLTIGSLPATEAIDPDPLADALTLLGACAWPSEAYWRLLELAAVRRHLLEVAGPVLELGCGDGVFTELAGLQVDVAVDREPRAVERAGRRQSVYRTVRRADIRDLDAALGSFGTIFSNSVLEHVPDVEPVLERCRELLVPGGRLIATVPLPRMNDHLAVRLPGYARARQRQLQHRNLWTIEEWRARLEAAGFETVGIDPYLDAGACRRWDSLDVLGALGTGRYRVAPALHRLATATLPVTMKRRLKARFARLLLYWARCPAEGPTCATVLVAATAATAA